MLASNRVFMDSKIGPATNCKLYGNSIHFLEEVIKQNNMMKSMKIEVLPSSNTYIKVSRSVVDKIKPKSKPKLFEHNIIIKSKENENKVIDASFLNPGSKLHKPYKQQEFEPGVLLIPNNNKAESFIYWKSKKLDIEVKYRQATIRERILWEKKKMMNEVKTFSGASN